MFASEAIRERLSDERLSEPDTTAVAAVALVYDHHATKLMEKLTNLQHSHLLRTICSMHIHLDAHNCMEIVVLRGRVGAINRIGKKILSQKGVKLGRINFIVAEQS